MPYGYPWIEVNILLTLALGRLGVVAGVPTGFFILKGIVDIAAVGHEGHALGGAAVVIPRVSPFRKL